MLLPAAKNPKIVSPEIPSKFDASNPNFISRHVGGYAKNAKALAVRAGFKYSFQFLQRLL